MIKLNFIKTKVLPTSKYYYYDNSEKYLLGIYNRSEINDLLSVKWYPTSEEYIKDFDINKGSSSFRFEEKALYYIQKRLIYEFMRQALLLRCRDKFITYNTTFKPALYKNPSIQNKINKIADNIRKEYYSEFINLYSLFFNKIDINKFKASKFIIFDTEFIHVKYPEKLNKSRHYTFPALYTTIGWYGPKKGFNININILNLPCHCCKIRCAALKNNCIRYECVAFFKEFINKQIEYVKDILDKHEGLKIYAYGNSDITQLSRSQNYFIGDGCNLEFARRNRKNKKKLEKIAIDISEASISLNDIENNILNKWLPSWSRKHKKINISKNIFTLSNKNEFEKNYYDLIYACMDDALSAFVYLLYKKFRL